MATKTVKLKVYINSANGQPLVCLPKRIMESVPKGINVKIKLKRKKK